MTHLTTTHAHPSVHNQPFTMIPNTIIDNKQLSALSKYLLIYLLRQQPGWKTHDSVLRCELHVGRDKLELLFRELRMEGYVRILPILGKGGRYLGSDREFASTPLWLNQKPSKNELPTEALITRAPVHPGPGEPGLCVNNTIVNNKDNNKQDPAREVIVVDKSEDVVCLEEEFSQQLLKFEVNLKTQKCWVKQYGMGLVKKKVKMLKVELSRGTVISSRGGWLKRALDENWMLSNRKKTSSVHFTHEETIAMLDQQQNYVKTSPEIAKNHMDEIKKVVNKVRIQ